MKMRRNMANAAAFGTSRQERRHRRGRALIDVRRPDLERRRRNFERQPDEHQRRRHADQRSATGACAAGERRADARQIAWSPSTP